jgi:hypothetical protein
VNGALVIDYLHSSDDISIYIQWVPKVLVQYETIADLYANVQYGIDRANTDFRGLQKVVLSVKIITAN